MNINEDNFMKKVIFACAGGMSTSLLVNKMKKEVTEKGLDINFIAISEQILYEELTNNSKDILAILLGPQIRFALTENKKEADKYGIPIDVIDPVAYGTMNAPKVLEQILNMIKK